MRKKRGSIVVQAVMVLSIITVALVFFVEFLDILDIKAETRGITRSHLVSLAENWPYCRSEEDIQRIFFFVDESYTREMNQLGIKGEYRWMVKYQDREEFFRLVSPPTVEEVKKIEVIRLEYTFNLKLLPLWGSVSVVLQHPINAAIVPSAEVESSDTGRCFLTVAVTQGSKAMVWPARVQVKVGHEVFNFFPPDQPVIVQMTIPSSGATVVVTSFNEKGEVMERYDAFYHCDQTPVP